MWSEISQNTPRVTLGDPAPRPDHIAGSNHPIHLGILFPLLYPPYISKSPSHLLYSNIPQYTTHTLPQNQKKNLSLHHPRLQKKKKTPKFNQSENFFASSASSYTEQLYTGYQGSLASTNTP
jgi:hypothetical protein